MPAHLLKRLLLAVPTLLGVTILVFVMLRISGDPTRFLVPPDAPPEKLLEVRKQLHLDEPLAVQYGYWLRDALRGNFGESYFNNRKVSTELAARVPATLELAATTMALATFVAIIAALLSARKPGGLFDGLTRSVVFVFLAVPAFWAGLELIILFSRKLLWLPPSGRSSESAFTLHGFADHAAHLALPAATLGLGVAAMLTRVLRASLLEALQADFTRTARAKGVSNRVVLSRHALRNALIPFITLGGISVAGLLEGSIIVESIFAWPGIGSRMVEAIRGRDTPIVMAGVLVISVTYTLVNLGVDVLYTVVDPRVRLDGEPSK